MAVHSENERKVSIQGKEKAFLRKLCKDNTVITIPVYTVYTGLYVFLTLFVLTLTSTR